MAPYSEMSLDIPGLRLAAKAWGDPRGPKLLGLHGWLDNANTFDVLAPLLPHCHLVALDLPGHGLSEHRHDSANYEFITWPSDVVWAAEALGWDRYGIIGHSLGAAIAPLVAAAVPDRMERLVLLDGIGPLTDDASEAPQRLKKSIRDVRRRPRRPLPSHASLEAAARRLLQVNPSLAPASAEQLVARGVRPTDGGVVWRHDPRLQAPSLLRFSEDQVQAFLSAVRCPVLAIRARQGWPIPEATLQARLDCIAGARLVEVDGAHHVHLDHAERVAGPIRAFIG